MLAKISSANWAIFGFIYALICAYLSIKNGQDLGPDLVNYHHYSGDCQISLKKCVGDFIPGGIQTYFNPVAHIPYALLLEYSSPKFLGFIFGFFAGGVPLSVFLISNLLLYKFKTLEKTVISFLLGILSIWNPFFMGLLGTSFTDILQSLLILISLFLIIISVKTRKEGYQYFGFALIGFSIGLKPVYIFYIPATLAIILFLSYKSKNLSTLLRLVLSLFVGFFVASAWWVSKVFLSTGNPFYPYANTIFKSTELDFVNNLSTNFPMQSRAKSVLDLIVYPINWSKGIPPYQEWNFQDIRFLLLLLIVVMVLFLRIFNFFKIHLEDEELLILIFFSISYLVWISLFGAVRYIIALFALAPIISVLLLAKIIKPKYLILITALLALIIIFFLKPVYFGRTPWDKSWSKVKIPNEISEKPYIYLLTGAESLYLPFFNSKSIFINYPFLIYGGDQLKKANAFINKSTNSDFKLIYGTASNGEFRKTMLNQYSTLGLYLDVDSCKKYFSRHPFQIMVCDLTKDPLVSTVLSDFAARMDRTIDGRLVSLDKISTPLSVENYFRRIEGEKGTFEFYGKPRRTNQIVITISGVVQGNDGEDNRLCVELENQSKCIKPLMNQEFREDFVFNNLKTDISDTTKITISKEAKNAMEVYIATLEFRSVDGTQ
jgi:hypothetical protein